MPLLEDGDAENDDVARDAGEVEDVESEADVIVRKAFDHLGRSMNDEFPRNSDDET